MPNEQLFSESEIADLVRRAAELQEAGSSKGYLPGVTRSELLRMAAEAGIDAAYLDKAIEERRTGRAETSNTNWRAEIERILPVEISPENFDIVTDAVKVMPVTTTKGVTSGGISQVGRTIQGQVFGGWDNPYFKITSRGGRTRLTIQPSGATAIGLPILWIIPMCITPVIGAVGNPVAGAIAAVGCAIGAFLSFRWLSKKATKAAAEVADKMESAILQASREGDVRLNLTGSEAASLVSDERTDVQA